MCGIVLWREDVNVHFSYGVQSWRCLVYIRSNESIPRFVFAFDDECSDSFLENGIVTFLHLHEKKRCVPLQLDCTECLPALIRSCVLEYTSRVYFHCISTLQTQPTHHHLSTHVEQPVYKKRVRRFAPYCICLLLPAPLSFTLRSHIQSSVSDVDTAPHFVRR